MNARPHTQRRRRDAEVLMDMRKESVEAALEHIQRIQSLPRDDAGKMIVRRDLVDLDVSSFLRSATSRY